MSFKEDKMKKVLITALALASVSGFAKSKDYRDDFRVKAMTAQGAYEKALDTVEEIKSARYKDKLPYLKKCNLRPNQYRDNFFFRRKAWTNSSWVTLNHVTGEYSAVVKVKCTIRKKRD